MQKENQNQCGVVVKLTSSSKLTDEIIPGRSFLVTLDEDGVANMVVARWREFHMVMYETIIEGAVKYRTTVFNGTEEVIDIICIVDSLDISCLDSTIVACCSGNCSPRDILFEAITETLYIQYEN